MKPNFSPKTIYILSGVVVAIGLGLMYMAYTSNSEGEAQIAALSKEVRDPNQVQREFDDAKLKVAELKQKLNHLEGGVQQFAYIPTLLKELEDYGKKANVTILEVKPAFVLPSTDKKDEARKKAYEELNVTVKARGSYADTTRLLNALRVFPKIVAIRTVSIGPKPEIGAEIRAGIPVLDTVLDIRAYAFKEEDTKAVEKKTENPKSASLTKAGEKHES